MEVISDGEDDMMEFKTFLELCRNGFITNDGSYDITGYCTS